MAQTRQMGRGQGQQRGSGMAQGGGRGAGRRGGGMGQGGNCICPSCGTKAPHEPGVPCASQKCPQCGSAMVRE